MKENSEAYQYWKKSNSHKTIIWAALGASFGIVAWGIGSSSAQDDPKYPVYGVFATGAVSFVFYSFSNSLRKKAILTYNKGLDIGEIRFGPSNNGLGLVLSFNENYLL